jgi:2,4-dichlorophenol 6-monooxygenase
VGKQIVARANQSRKDYGPLNDTFRVPGQEHTVEAGLARLHAPTPEGVELREKLQEALEGKNYEFNAHGVELNQRYESAAVIPDPNAGEEQWAKDPQLYVQPTTRPGAKIPHAWLVDRNGNRTSTLDVTGHGKFTLVTGLAGRAWETAAQELDKPFLRTVVVGEKGAEDPYGAWYKVREIHEAGALLVRPDGYIAWRQTAPVWDLDTARAELSSALDAVLANTEPKTAEISGDSREFTPVH